MKQTNFSKPLMLSLIIWLPFFMHAQTISGQIFDKKVPLLGAEIQIIGTTESTTTDIDGHFELTTTKPLPLTLEVNYSDYKTLMIDIVESRSEIRIILNIAPPLAATVTVNGLRPIPKAKEAPTSLSHGLELRKFLPLKEIKNPISSVSRKREALQESLASASIISANRLAISSNPVDPNEHLINTVGVQITQQSAARINIELRGQNTLFGTGIMPIMDDRNLKSPGIDFFQSSNIGLSNLDIDKIEVVRGSNTSLYGVGATSGVIHYITKNPIDYPGSSIEIFGGELNTIGGAIRHASASTNKRFGYKINAQFRHGDEFSLDLMTANWNNMAVNTTLEFRPKYNLSIFFSGGFNRSKELFYEGRGEGLAQNSEYWMQARVQKGDFFGQVFYVNNDGGTKERPTFLYQTGQRLPMARKQLEAQLKYSVEIPSIKAAITTGLDYRMTISDTENLINGRNEQDDNYIVIGAYLQSEFEVAPKLDVILAGRYDVFNFLKGGAFSPRLAMVYKASPKHTFRLTYNRANTPPSSNIIYADFPIATPSPGFFDLWLTGNKEPHIWENPVIDVIIPGIPDLPYDSPGLPLIFPFEAVNQLIINRLVLDLMDDPYGIIPFLSNFKPEGFTGTFRHFNILTGEPLTDLIASETPQLSKINSFEIGYKGSLSRKLNWALDVYYNKNQGFTLLTALGPAIALDNTDISTDLVNVVAEGLTNHLINTAGLDVSEAESIALSIASGYAPIGPPFLTFPIFGTVESNLAPNIDGIHLPIGYRYFEDAFYDYIGIDIGLEYDINKNFSTFFNYAYISQNVWSPETGSKKGLPVEFGLNTPQNRFRLGAFYTPQSGFRGSIAFQHDDSYTRIDQFSQFNGDTDAKNLVDLIIGYKFKYSGLELSLSAKNLLNNEYRAFNHAPKIGRRITFKATYQ